MTRFLKGIIVNRARSKKQFSIYNVIRGKYEVILTAIKVNTITRALVYVFVDLNFILPRFFKQLYHQSSETKNLIFQMKLEQFLNTKNRNCYRFTFTCWWNSQLVGNGITLLNAHARIFGSSSRMNKFLVGESSLVSRNLFIILSLRKYSRTCYIIKKYCVPKYYLIQISRYNFNSNFLSPILILILFRQISRET